MATEKDKSEAVNAQGYGNLADLEDSKHSDGQKSEETEENSGSVVKAKTDGDESTNDEDVTAEHSESEDVVADEELSDQEEDPLVMERDKLKDQLLRMAADFDNYRKRARRDIEDTRIRAREDTLRELLPIFDNLKRALSASQEAKNTDSIIEGVQMVLKLFEDTGEQMGLKHIKSVGERFDPAIHDAIQQIETSEYPAGTIISEITAGYTIADHLLRPAMVVVARPQKDDNPSEEIQNSAEEQPVSDTPIAESSGSEASEDTVSDDPRKE